jgi:hypothetical protein
LIYLFDDYSLDTDRRELRRGLNLVALEPQVFDLLQHLILNRDRVVSAADLAATVWRGRTVCSSAARNTPKTTIPISKVPSAAACHRRLQHGHLHTPLGRRRSAGSGARHPSKDGEQMLVETRRAKLIDNYGAWR